MGIKMDNKSLKEKVRERKEQKSRTGGIIEENEKIIYYSPYTSKEIEEAYLPVTKSKTWYKSNCVGEDRKPDRAVNGHPGGTPFYTKDKKIMRSGKTTWDELEIKLYK